jgi:hypothetical protein
VHPLTLNLSSAGGKRLLHHTFDRAVRPDDPLPSQSPSGAMPERQADEVGWYEEGLRYEQLDDRDKALVTYPLVLAGDPAHGPAALRLGMMTFKAGEDCSAEDYLRRAAVAGQHAARLYLGVLSMRQHSMQQEQIHAARRRADKEPCS